HSAAYRFIQGELQRRQTLSHRGTRNGEDADSEQDDADFHDVASPSRAMKTSSRDVAMGRMLVTSSPWAFSRSVRRSMWRRSDSAMRTCARSPNIWTSDTPGTFARTPWTS